MAGEKKRKILRTCLKVVDVAHFASMGLLVGVRFAKHYIEQAILRDEIEELIKKNVEPFTVVPLNEHETKPTRKPAYPEDQEVYDS